MPSSRREAGRVPLALQVAVASLFLVGAFRGPADLAGQSLDAVHVGARDLGRSQAGEARAAPPVFLAVGSAGARQEAGATAALVGAGLAGGAVGAVAGFYLGALMASGDDGGDLDFLSGAVAGAAIGEGLLLPYGVHLANRKAGSYPVSALVSLGLAAAGLAALEAVHYDPPGAPIVLVAVPVAQIAASIAIERATE